MTVLLAGDIGGTKTILRLVEQSSEGEPLQVLAQQSYPSQEFGDLVPIVNQFLREEGADRGYPERACFAIAGPVEKNEAKLTNLIWHLQGDRLQEELHLQQVSLINDFAAIGYGILGLGQEDLYCLQEAQPQPQAPIAVIGAGTGLGEGFLTPDAGGNYQVFSCEGGHTDFAPRNLLESDLLHYLLEKYQWERVSVERVVSGMGIVAIYEFLRDRQWAEESSELIQVFKTWKSQMGKENTETAIDPAAAISQSAQQKSDRLSEETMNIFIEAYGAEAGNLALKLLPYGGLYIAGGVAAKNLSLMTDGQFLQAFLNKGRMSRLLQQIPIYIVTNQEVGLIGAALCAAKA
ncbi:glucokinase [Roseofilum sp. BLCC_M91]|uniref:Glucokinase n=1 Tax=Roseofilum halophilum BLCC-M91 TaxID=3022259 RepID=A0ABT7BMG4_9CYAN|nr:glucokinase [Roseofilum halophilum]MDJ1179661.1 glucokinase [Roseofilum halophilum BLCC-M91]